MWHCTFWTPECIYVLCVKCLNMKCDAMQVRWCGIVSVCPMSHNIADRSHHSVHHAPDTGLHPAHTSRHPAHTTPPSIYVSIKLHKVTKIYLLSIFFSVSRVGMWWVWARQEATHNEASDMEWWGKDDWNSGICYLEYLFDFCMGMMINNSKRQYHTSTPSTPSTPPCRPCRTGSGRTARATPRRGRRPRGGYTPGPPGQTRSRSRRRNSTWGQQHSLMSVFVYL